MLRIRVGQTESYNEATNEFVLTGGVEVDLEHSLVSLSKWETIHEKPFLDDSPKTSAELLSYIECMAVGELTPGFFVEHPLSETNVTEIQEYFNKKLTATWVTERSGGSPSREVVTSELIYYWMAALNLHNPTYEAWPLARLFMLIRVANVKQSDQKPMSPAEAAARRRELNAQRRAAAQSKG